MQPGNLRHLYDVVAAWNRATRELREHLAGIHQAEGYQHHDHSQSVIGEAVLLRGLDIHLTQAQDITAGC
jgi:hypothetical protein